MRAVNTDNTKLLDSLISKESQKKTPMSRYNHDISKLDSVLNPVRDQGRDGTCYAFATACALEVAYLRKYGQKVRFSEQEIVDCTVVPNMDEKNQVSGAFVHEVVDAVKTKGLARIGKPDDESLKFNKYNGVSRWHFENGKLF